MKPLPAPLLADLSLRHDKLRAALAAAQADALILTLNADLIYASGTVFGGWFYLPASGSPVFFFRRPSDFPVRIPEFKAVAVRRPDQIAEYLAAAGRPVPARLYPPCGKITLVCKQQPSYTLPHEA